MGRCACESDVRLRDSVLRDKVELKEIRRFEWAWAALGLCKAAPLKS
jgi:hypothetical protein